MINACKQRIEAGLIESSGEIILKIFHEAADLSLEKKVVKDNFSKKRSKKSQKKWVDKECIKLKELANKTAILKQKNPWNNNLRVSHRNILKESKKVCRKKENKFWQYEMMKFENINNIENLWDNWKQLSEDLINRNSHPENLDGKKWETTSKTFILE